MQSIFLLSIISIFLPDLFLILLRRTVSFLVSGNLICRTNCCSMTDCGLTSTNESEEFNLREVKKYKGLNKEKIRYLKIRNNRERSSRARGVG